MAVLSAGGTGRAGSIGDSSWVEMALVAVSVEELHSKERHFGVDSEVSEYTLSGESRIWKRGFPL